MKTFSLRLDNAVLESIGEAAKQQRLSKQQWVENAVRERLESEAAPDLPESPRGRGGSPAPMPAGRRRARCEHRIRPGSFCKMCGTLKT